MKQLKFDMTEYEISEISKRIAQIAINTIKVIAQDRIEQAIKGLSIRCNEKDSVTISFPVEFSALLLFTYLEMIKKENEKTNNNYVPSL
jgi:hypothetical protein